MNELTLKMDLEGMQTIASNLEEVRQGLIEMTAVFKDYRVTPENLQESKKTLADLRKAETALEDERKRVKKAWQKPYEDWEKQYKLAIVPLQYVIDQMAKGVSDITSADDEKRRIGRIGFIDSLLKPMNIHNRVVIKPEQIWIDSWKNKSVSDERFTEESTARIQQIMKDLAFLQDKDRAVILKYTETLSLTEALDYEKTLKDFPTAPAEDTAAPASDNAGPSYEFSYKEGTPAEDEKEVVVFTRTFRAPKWKMNIMMSIAKAMGIQMKKS